MTTRERVEEIRKQQKERYLVDRVRMVRELLAYIDAQEAELTEVKDALLARIETSDGGPDYREEILGLMQELSRSQEEVGIHAANAARYRGERDRNMQRIAELANEVDALRARVRELEYKVAMLHQEGVLESGGCWHTRWETGRVWLQKTACEVCRAVHEGRAGDSDT